MERSFGVHHAFWCLLSYQKMAILRSSTVPSSALQDLIDQRISHARAAQAMRELDARAKGGWLVKAMRAKQ